MSKDQQQPPPETIEQKLDRIALYLHRMERRDRIRTWWGSFHALLGLIPLVILLWSVWYAYEHGDELLMKMTKQAAQQAAEMTRDQSTDFMDRLNQYFGR